MLTVRKLQESDRKRLEEKIASDPIHSANGMSADLFFDKDTESLVYEDEKGVVFTLNLSRAVRARIQFEAEPERVKAALEQGFKDFLGRIRRTDSVKEVIFESTFVPLINFCREKLGFKSSPSEHIHVVHREKRP